MTERIRLSYLLYGLFSAILKKNAIKTPEVIFHVCLRAIRLSSWLILKQSRSQGLSSLLPLVVGRKTLVEAGHVTTQNLGGKKICWIGGVAEYFVC